MPREAAISFTVNSSLLCLLLLLKLSQLCNADFREQIQILVDLKNAFMVCFFLNYASDKQV